MITYGFISFEWDTKKAEANYRKHKVDFKEASTVFYDPHALVIDDEGHSYNENRYIILGVSSVARTLIACHCYKEAHEVIRIISARKATKNEEATYWRHRYES